MARARLWFLTMVRTAKSSITIVWFSRTSRVVTLCGQSRRRSSHSSDTNQRPAASCGTVTVDGHAPPGNGRDHPIGSG
ncbi:hypothetical protein AOZ06_18955 [Kibdelosporangium phytohabitans]|uniref:Uncharacterized protein n=1 Tax=Kibdelosporangium phytohabitans TaxID=860235 RepID=A0A0N9HUP1_9PSEU|nr:hypothetical protein AOZ06_18955 [Kibdelosporangium phytohabitans]